MPRPLGSTSFIATWILLGNTGKFAVTKGDLTKIVFGQHMTGWQGEIGDTMLGNGQRSTKHHTFNNLVQGEITQALFHDYQK